MWATFAGTLVNVREDLVNITKVRQRHASASGTSCNLSDTQNQMAKLSDVGGGGANGWEPIFGKGMSRSTFQ